MDVQLPEAQQMIVGLLFAARVLQGPPNAFATFQSRELLSLRRENCRHVTEVH
jgi:hypothetical protein